MREMRPALYHWSLHAAANKSRQGACACCAAYKCIIIPFAVTIDRPYARAKHRANCQ